MSIFNRLFKLFRDEEPDDFTYIVKIAGLISDNEPYVIEQLTECAEDPWGYGEEREERYLERGISVAGEDTTNAREICWIGMVDELAEHGFVAGVDYKCELSDFLWSLKQLKNYSFIADTVQKLELSESDSVEAWGEKINSAPENKAFVCMIDIDSDSYEIIIAAADVYEKISGIARANGHIIDSF